MYQFKKIKAFFEKRSKLDLFLLKAGTLLVTYYLLRIVIKFTPWFRPVFIFFRKLLTQIILKVSYFFLNLMGYEVSIYKKIIWIEGSQGVRVINACLGWSVMALFIGFILIYPGIKKSKFWFIPLGLVIVVFSNIIRISAMVLISYHHYRLMDFYHKYVFNIFLYVTIFALWIVWVRRYGHKNIKEE